MKAKTHFIISNIIILIFSIALFPLVSFFMGALQGEIIRNLVFSVLYSLGLFFFFHYSYHYKILDYDNAEHPYRFMISFLIGLFLSVLFPFVDKKAWMFLSIAVALALFSNSIIAMYSISGMIMFSVLLSAGADKYTFFVYFLVSSIGILLFHNIDESFSVGSSIFTSVIILTVSEIAGFVFLENEYLNFEQFIMPIVNVVINSLTLLFVLKYFNQIVANKYRNKYLELNDQEFKTLVELKNISKDDYFKTIHTAYLVERMASAIGCNEYLAKNCAYYYRVSSAFKLDKENFEKLLNENEFPPEAKELLLALFDGKKFPSNKEAGLVYISDKMITSLISIFTKDKNKQIDFNALIDALFDNDNFLRNLTDSDLSLRDMRLIKEILKKETLYYDFLR